MYWNVGVVYLKHAKTSKYKLCGCGFTCAWVDNTYHVSHCIKHDFMLANSI